MRPMICLSAALLMAGLAKGQAPLEPYGPVPSARQLAWHELELYGFIHFTTNTFTDKEWGYGDESPSVFAPSDFDAREILQVFKEAGMRGAILTCKHHDGFCLWDSRYTEHDVANSPWKNGKGDVVKEFADACRELDLAFGVYLSPWDRNHPEYGRAEYVTYFRDQMRELLTNYGSVFVLWCDGANGGDGYYGGARETRRIDRGTYYDWERTFEIAYDLQETLCVFSDFGPEIRWVGNEHGEAGDPCWARYTPAPREGESKAGPGTTRYWEGENGHRDGTAWIPAEVDVSIRPGWFYHESQNDQVRSGENLVNLYYDSVGKGASLNLNVPPDRRGRLHPNDVASLREFRRLIDATFDRNLVHRGIVEGKNTREGHSIEALIDGNRDSYWATKDGVHEAELVVRFAEPQSFNVVDMREYLPLGQRVHRWSVDSSETMDEEWTPYAAGESIGSRRLHRGDYVTARAVRVRTAGPVPVALSEFGLYAEPPEVRLEPESTDFLETTTLRMEAGLEDWDLRYTLDGSAPSSTSPRYERPVVLDRSCEVRVLAFDKEGRPSPRETRRHYTKWQGQLLPAIQLFVPPRPGIRYSVFRRGMQTLDQLDDAKPADEGVREDLSIAFVQGEEHVAVVWNGYLEVPEEALYRFWTESDDGSRLWIDGRMIVDNDGLHGMVRKEGVVGMKAGYHRIRVAWFNATGGAGLAVGCEGPGFEKGPLPQERLLR